MTRAIFVAVASNAAPVAAAVGGSAVRRWEAGTGKAIDAPGGHASAMTHALKEKTHRVGVFLQADAIALTPLVIVATPEWSEEDARAIESVVRAGAHAGVTTSAIGLSPEVDLATLRRALWPLSVYLCWSSGSRCSSRAGSSSPSD